MSASHRAKELGAKSLKQIAEAWGTTTQALSYQHKENPHKFDIIVSGVLNLRSKSQNNTSNKL